MKEEILKKLLESHNQEDVSLGIACLYQQYGSTEELKTELYKYTYNVKMDIYIGDLNIVLWGFGDASIPHLNKVSVYRGGLPGPLSDTKPIYL